MEKYIVKGGRKLYGDVEINGGKNAAVAIIPAALLVKGTCRIENLPLISDVDTLLLILESLGAKVNRISASIVEIDCTNAGWENGNYDLMRAIRASYYFIGSMLGRFGEAKTTMPGGCNFGLRPIDQHVKGMNGLGANVDIVDGYIYAVSPDRKLHGNYIYLDKVSVGATMNVIIAAAMAEGKTTLENAAKEPHIVDLANFLNSMGADIRGAGTDTVKINGVSHLTGGTYTIIPDQIEAGTYMAAVAATGGEVRINNVIPRHLDCISAKLREMGVEIEEEEESVVVRSDGRLKPCSVKTQPYPGFPTDMQPQMGALLSIADGEGVIEEAVYDGNRYKYIGELSKMGARVKVNGSIATFTGVSKLKGAPVVSCDLRAGAAMVIAGLCAEGTTEVRDIQLIERGYQDFVGKLRAIGADITLVGTPDD